MPTAENKRRAVVENEARHIKDAVADLSKTVTGFDGKLDGVLLYIAGEKGAKQERRREGVWLRLLLSVGIPAIVSIVGFFVGKAV